MPDGNVKTIMSEEKSGWTNVKDIPTQCEACGFTAKWEDFWDMDAENRKPEDEELCPKCGSNDEDGFVFLEM